MSRDSEEFAEFVALSQASLRRTAYLICGDWDLASDHVQEGLIRVYRRWRRLERDGRLRGYARKAVVSAAIDAGRRRSSTELATGRVLDTSTPDPSEAVDQRERVLAALAALPPGQRACVVLRYYEDLPVAEVADALGISAGTVKSQTARGLSALQTHLTDRSDDSDPVISQRST